MKSLILALLLFGVRPAPQLIPRGEHDLVIQWITDYGPSDGYLTDHCTIQTETIQADYPQSYWVTLRYYDKDGHEVKKTHYLVVAGRIR